MVKKLFFGIAFVLVIALLATTSYSGKIYKWRDSSGVVHYSDTPPDASASESIGGYKLDEGSDPAPPAKERPAEKSVRKDSKGSPAGAGAGMLWKIEGRGKRPSYILGTIHSGDERVMRLPEEVSSRFDEATSFAMEVKMDMSTILQSASAMFLSGGQDLKEILGDDLFQEVDQAMAGRGVPGSMLRMLKPWAVIVLLSAPPSSSMVFLDSMLSKRATEQGKNVHGLESPEEQLGVFESMSMEDQVEMLRTTLRKLPDMPALIEEMIQAYVADDLMTLAELGLSSMGDDDGVNEEFLKRINEDRNRRMVQRMMPLLDEGGAFIAVGALHLPFETGILKLLEQKGCTVTPVSQGA